MLHAILEREFESPLTQEHLDAMSASSADCLNLFRIEWQESFLADDGRKMLCHFLSPDLESVRVLTRRTDCSNYSLWSGSLHDTSSDQEVTVVIERQFDQPADIDALQALENAASDCLAMHRVSFVKTFIANDKKRMICLYRAPDAESVRVAQRQAKMPVTRVWACGHLKRPQN